MPAGRVSMRHVREILRLGSAGISKHEIARRTGLAPSTVRETLSALRPRAWPGRCRTMSTDGDLEALLYKNAGTKQGHRRQVEPDWAAIHRELKRKHVTLSILWDEYIEQHPDGYRYSRFCDLLPGLGRQAVGHDAPAPCRRREAVRRLRRRQGAGGDRPADRRDPGGLDFCRRPRRVQLHLCRGDLDARAGGLDRRPHARFRGDRRGAAAGRARQHQDRRHQGVPLRAVGQPDLYRDGGALRHRHPADTAPQATRQGEGRGRRADHGALDSRAPAEPVLLQPGGAERGDP